MSAADLARVHYNDQLALDEALPNSSPEWATIGINDVYVRDLRAAVAGSLQDDQLVDLLGNFIKRYRLRGDIEAATGTPQWRKIARSLADAELEVLARMHDRA